MGDGYAEGGAGDDVAGVVGVFGDAFEADDDGEGPPEGSPFRGDDGEAGGHGEGEAGIAGGEGEGGLGVDGFAMAVGWLRQPIFRSGAPKLSPGVPFSTTRAETPRAPASPVRTMTT